MSKLFIFSGTYPFGFRESFLEQEIPYLAKQFDKITIIPLSGTGTKMREVPEGVIVDSRLHCNRKLKVLLGVLNCWRVFPSYFLDFIESKVYLEKRKLKIWVKSTVLTSFYLQSKPVREIKRNITKKDLLYYYWGVEYNNIAPFFTGKCKQISRFHGDWDLWRDGGVIETYSPRRKDLVNSLDCAIAISNKGNDFLKEHYPSVNVRTFRLGSEDHGCSRKSKDGYYRVLSCSSVYPLKRVDLIYKCVRELASNRKKVIWTHIGDGPSFDELREICTPDLSCEFQVFFTGRLSHDKVLDYYKKNNVDAFINLSTNEGIPVSVMEAISFNVPVVATNVGATQEIVTSNTGVLVPADPTLEEVVDALLSLQNRELRPRDFWNDNFNAEKNYHEFSCYLKSLII